MKKSIFVLTILFVAAQLQAQIVQQPGRVRKITYSHQEHIVPVSDVRLKVETETRSNENGSFTLKFASGKENTFVFEQIFKAGYTLVSPTIGELALKKYPVNPQTEIEVILAKTDEQMKERQRIESNIRRQKEAEIAEKDAIIAQKDTELATLKETDTRYKTLLAERDSLAGELQNFSSQYYESDKFIMEEADKLSKIDYYTLDSIEIINTDLKKQGKGKEIVTFNRSLIDEKVAQLLLQSITQREEELEKLKNTRDMYALRYKDIADGFKLQYMNDSTLVYLKKRVDLEPENADYLLDYGDFLDFVAQYEEALEVYQKALEIVLNQLGEYNEKASTLYNHIGYVYSNMDDYSQALEYFLKVLRILEKILDNEHPEIAISNNNIGYVYYNMSDYPQALEYYQKALKIREKVLDNEDLEAATLYTNFGAVYGDMGDYPLALEYFQKALDIRDKVMGNEHIEVTVLYNNIAHIYNKQSNYPLALEYHQKALKIKEKILGKEHPYTAISCNNIGLVYANMGDDFNALEYYQKALKIREKVLGKEHSRVAISYNNIGGVYFGKGDYPNALEYYQKALKIAEKILGNEHPYVATVYNNIGLVHKSQGDYPLALEYYQKDLEIGEKVLGKEHPDVAISYNNIGSVYYKQGNYPQALVYYQKALDIQEKVLGKEHPDVATSYNNIGLIYKSQGDYSKEMEYHQKALEITEKVLGDEHPNTKQLYITLINCLFSAIDTGQSENNTERVKNYTNELEELMRTRFFTAEVTEGDYSTYNKGLRGKYYVLFYEGWECTDNKNLFSHKTSLQDKPKKLVLMKDGKISEYQFGSEDMGIQLGLDTVTEKEKKEILEQYEKWKKSTR